MPFSFDLISDLHIESWPEPLDWSLRATSAWCVVAGDVARDRNILQQTLTHLGQCYQAVFYIDGNDEHNGRMPQLAKSYRDLKQQISQIPGVVYIQDNVVILDQIAILGTNGWWSYDFVDTEQREQCQQWWCDTFGIDAGTANTVTSLSHTDAVYINKSLARLQNEDVRHVVLVTHTVPDAALIAHDPELAQSELRNVMGNSHMISALAGDWSRKVHTWCFGHYHGKIDQINHGVRFVNNCRGRGNSPWRQMVYHPLKIVISD